MKICIHTLGCKVNQYESDVLAECLRKLGHEVSTELEIADVYILNSCAVTNEAERKSRQAISKFYALNPNARVLVCGCASEKDDSQFSALKNVNYVSGVANKMKLIEKLEEDGAEIDPLPTAYENFGLSTSSNTRAYVKIQDGCNNFCSYCIIPYLRGRSRSRDIVSILNEVEGLVSGAVNEDKPYINEIVLTGINLSDFKIDGKSGLITLLKELDKFSVRIRLGSLEQGLISDEFLKEAKSLQNFCPHFHLSMQSGSNTVLKRMNRKYTKHEYLKSVKKIRKYFENPAITTDVIVGFLGETNKEFKETLKTIKKAKFASMHIFPYSLRTGTVAEKMLLNGKYSLVAGEIVKKRVKKLEKLNRKLKKRYLLSISGKTFQMLVETVHDGYLVGHTENFVKCYLPADNVELNTLQSVEIVEPYKDGALVKLN